MGCVFILGNLASSKFIVGCLMVHGAVLESMVWCTILVLILISLRRSLILKLKRSDFFWVILIQVFIFCFAGVVISRILWTGDEFDVVL